MSGVLERLLAFLGEARAYVNWENTKLLIGAFVLGWILLAIYRRTDLGSRIRYWTQRTLGVRWREFQTRRGAEKAERSKDWLQAGLGYQQIGDFDRALDCFENAGDNHLAGELCLEMGHAEIAADSMVAILFTTGIALLDTPADERDRHVENAIIQLRMIMRGAEAMGKTE